MMRLILCLVAGVLITTAAIAEPRRIGFNDLPDPGAMDFDDPFRAMEAGDLANLKTVVMVRERLAAGKVEPAERPRVEAIAKEKSASLEARGYDIDVLMKRRWEVARKRRNAALATNPALDGALVAMSGYIIPGLPLEDGSATGYLVQAVGLCSHLPTPPPNLLVRVRLAGTKLPEVTLYTPLTVTGKLHADANDETIFVLDGEVRMISGWTLEIGKATVAPSTDPGPGGKKHPLQIPQLLSSGKLKN